MDTNNLYTACTLNDQLRMVQAKIVGLEHQVSLILLFCTCILKHTVNSEIFARVLFSRNFAGAKFREKKTLAKWRYNFAVY